MFDFDPRDYDSRDDERHGTNRGSRGGSGDRDREDDSSQPEIRPRQREDDNARTLGRGREIVRDRDREYTLRGSESRTLATVGAFRVVSSRDLQDHRDHPVDPRSGDLRHLREQGLVETIRIAGSRDYAVALTKEGRSL